MADEKKISPEVESMAKVIEKHIEIDSKTGNGTEKESVFEKTLPDDLSIETVKKVNDHNSNFIAAGAYAFGQMAIKAMSKNASLEEADLKLKMAGRDHVEYHMNRQKTYANHLTGNGESVVKYGVLTTEYQVSGGRNSGQLKHVRDELAEIAQKALNK
jgi:hypothetical protein